MPSFRSRSATAQAAASSSSSARRWYSEIRVLITSNCPKALQQGEQSSVFHHHKLAVRCIAIIMTIMKFVINRPAGLFRLVLTLLLCTGESIGHVGQMILESEQSAFIPGAAGVSTSAPRPSFPPAILVVIWTLPTIDAFSHFHPSLFTTFGLRPSLSTTFGPS